MPPFSGFLTKEPCEYRWRSWLVHKSHTFLVCLLTRFAKFFLMKLPAVEICMPWVKLAPYSPCVFFPRCRICVLHWCVRHGQRWHYRCIIWSSGSEFLSPMNEFMDAYGPWLVTVLRSFSCIPPLNHIFLAGWMFLPWLVRHVWHCNSWLPLSEQTSSF